MSRSEGNFLRADDGSLGASKRLFDQLMTFDRDAFVTAGKTRSESIRRAAFAVLSIITIILPNAG